MFECFSKRTPEALLGPPLPPLTSGSFWMCCDFTAAALSTLEQWLDDDLCPLDLLGQLQCTKGVQLEGSMI